MRCLSVLSYWRGLVITREDAKGDLPTFRREKNSPSGCRCMLYLPPQKDLAVPTRVCLLCGIGDALKKGPRLPAGCERPGFYTRLYRGNVVPPAMGIHAKEEGEQSFRSTPDQLV